MESALAELDRCLGHRKSGMVISGFHVPTYKDIRSGEDPLYLTMRTLVLPMMYDLGYGRISAYDVEDDCVPGLVLAVSSMNRPLESAISRVICSMKADGSDKGIATDGFRWALIKRRMEGARVSVVSDLRPYYVEILDRNRFREACTVDCGELLLFTDSFNKVRYDGPMDSNQSAGNLSMTPMSRYHGQDNHGHRSWNGP